MPVTMEATKVPKIAKVTMAPKLEKNGFCKIKFITEVILQSNNKEIKIKVISIISGKVIFLGGNPKVRKETIHKRFIFLDFIVLFIYWEKLLFHPRTLDHKN